MSQISSIRNNYDYFVVQLHLLNYIILCYSIFYLDCLLFCLSGSLNTLQASAVLFAISVQWHSTIFSVCSWPAVQHICHSILFVFTILSPPLLISQAFCRVCILDLVTGITKLFPALDTRSFFLEVKIILLSEMISVLKWVYIVAWFLWIAQTTFLVLW